MKKLGEFISNVLTVLAICGIAFGGCVAFLVMTILPTLLNPLTWIGAAIAYAIYRAAGGV